MSSARERKLATILFGDLVGSTELGSALDPEVTRDLLDRFYDSMESEIALGGGSLEKFIGDAVVAVFGAPAAQEDHAERALQVALWMQEQMAELFGEQLALRIGVNSGEVVIGRPRAGSSFATGDAVNVAARLEQAAEPGQVLVGARTAALVGAAFELGEPRTVEAKGKEGGVQCRELVRMLAPRRPRGRQGAPAAFVGRAAELELLEQAVLAAAEDRSPRLVTVVGEAGVGKTTLLREFRNRIPEEIPLLVGRCLSYGRGVTYAPLADILRARFDLREDDTRETLLERLNGRELLGLMLGLDVAGDIDPRAAVLMLQDEWVQLASELVGSGVAVLVIEDLHWAAEPLLELIERLRRDVEGPLVLLATTRPDGPDAAPEAAVNLEPLPDDEARELLDRALGAPLDDAARDLLIRQGGGNPFFLEELLSDLLDRGRLERRNGGWSLPAAEVGVGVPDTVQAVLAGRIDLLPTDAKEAVLAAAVIGRSFSPAGLAALVGSAAEVRTLVDRGFVHPAGSELVFKHGLTREVAYSALPKVARAQLHAAYATWLERDNGGDGRAGALAYHYAEAVAPEIAELAWRERDDEAARLRTSALHWLRRAADLSLTRFDLDDALSHLRRATELAPCDPDLWHAAGRLHALKFDGQAMWPAMEKALDLTDDPARLADLYAELAFESTLRGGMWKRPPDLSLLQTWLDRALQLAEPQTLARGRALATKAMLEDDAELAEQALALAEQLDDPVLLSYACFARSGAAFLICDYVTANEWAERRFALQDRLSDPDKIAHILYYGATAALAVGRPDDAEALARKHDAIASRLSTHHEVHALGVLLFVEEALARWDSIRELQPRVERAVAENTGTPCVLNPRTLLSCAVADAELGLDEEARRLEDAAAAHGFQGYGFWLDPPVAHLSLLRGDLDRVESLLGQSGATWHESMDGSLYGAVTRLDALVALGRTDEAEAAASDLLQPGTYVEPFALRTLGIVREEPALVAQAAERFEATGLDRHAHQTRAQASS